MIGRIYFAIFASAVMVLCNGQDFNCPDKTGFFPDPYQCDLYYKCSKGKPEAKLCPDGLVFMDENPNKEKCDIPSNVDCGDRRELQEPKPSQGCPRANGYFRHEDPDVCDKFFYCVEGKVIEMPCPPGLYFNEEDAICDWIDQSKGKVCEHNKRDVLDDGFSCPAGETLGPNGRALPHPTFPHPEDCQKFYICRNGIRPQKGSCPLGEVYNDETFKCDEPANVEGCENYYQGKDLISKSAKKTGAGA